MVWRKATKLARLLAHPGYWRGLMFGVAATLEHRDALGGLDLATVVDIGANKGQFSLFARDAFPGARITAFEPLAEPAARFAALFAGDRRITLHRVAIGPERGKATIHVAARDDSSSLLPITERQTALYPDTRLKETRTIDVAPLDAFLDAADVAAPALLKLDVQGFELEALKGCEALLDRFSYVYAECSYVELYTGQALADQVVAHLAARGFGKGGTFNLTRDADGCPVQADVLFTRA